MKIEKGTSWPYGKQPEWGKARTKKQIYKAVWKDDYVYDDNNIMALVSKIRKKIEDDPENPKIIQTVRGVGYRFGGGQ